MTTMTDTHLTKCLLVSIASLRRKLTEWMTLAAVARLKIWWLVVVVVQAEVDCAWRRTASVPSTIPATTVNMSGTNPPV